MAERDAFEECWQHNNLAGDAVGKGLARSFFEAGRASRDAEVDNLKDTLRELVTAQRRHGPINVELRIKCLLGPNWDARSGDGGQAQGPGAG